MVAALGLAPACYAGVEVPGEDEAGDSADGTADTGDTADTGNTGDTGEQAELPSPSPRFYRLTHEQWENTVRDLFGLAEVTGYSELFREDPTIAGFIFDNDATTLEVDEALWTGYRIAASEVAADVTADPDILAALTPAEGPSEAERIEEFVRSFGAKAYRRPLTDEEVATLSGLFSSAPPLYTNVADPFTAGMRHVIEAVLQSPFFLYRIERSEEIAGPVIPLDDHEIASRLSYFLWNTMPDDELFAAAEADQLHTAEQVAIEAERMLQDPRAADMVVRFHGQLLEVEKLETISPSPNFFPDAPPDLAALAHEEHERFIRDVIFGDGGGLIDLLTSNQSFVNDDLAAIYGVPGVVGEDFVNVELPPEQRKGVFTQIGFLAANSTSVDPDPIHRGVFLAKRMACLAIAAPPDGVPPLPAIEEGQTNRERVEAHTEAEGTVCVTCHSTLINPYGFPFEIYDALGAWRTTDNGQPVDPSSTVFLGSESAPVPDALGLMDAMAASPDIHACYAQHWIEYAAGRNTTGADNPMIDRLGSASLEDQQSLRDLLVALTTSPAFLNRAAEELQ